MDRSIQLAAALATLAVAASAAAQSNVTLYGRLDMSFDHVSIKSTTGSSRSLTALSNDGSRWGMRGTEDLGGGLSANFNVESGFAVDTGASTQGGLLFGRTAWVGLSSTSFGEFRFGRNYIPLDDMAWQYDPFYAGGEGAMWPLQPYTSRIDNSIKYISPMLGKFQLGALVSAGENVPNAGKQQAGFSAQFKDTAFEVAFAYTKVNEPSATSSDRKETYLGGALKFNGPRLVASVFQRDDQGAQKLTTADIGGNLPLAGGDLRVSFARVSQGDESTNQSSIGYWYPLSKRTFVYGALTRQNNSANRNPSINPSFATKSNGEDVTATQLGIRHNF